MRNVNRPLSAVLACAAVLAGAAGAGAQQRPAAEAPLQPLFVYGGLQALYARPSGEFRQYVRHGYGLAGNIVFPVTVGSMLALRADAGFLIYGSERKRVCFGGGVGCRVQLDLTTTNDIMFLNVGPQLMLQRGAVRPYASGSLGFAHFGTSSQVEGSGDQQPFARTTNFDDTTLAWNGGGGLLIPLSTGRVPVLLDLGARYHANGRVEYLTQGDIQDNPDGSISFTPTRSQANLITFQLGVSVGGRRPLH
jgi:hypothetical protein